MRAPPAPAAAGGTTRVPGRALRTAVLGALVLATVVLAGDGTRAGASGWPPVARSPAGPRWVAAGPDVVVGAARPDPLLLQAATAAQSLTVGPIDVLDGPEGFTVITGVVRNHGTYVLRSVDSGTASEAIGDLEDLIATVAPELSGATGWSFTTGSRAFTTADPIRLAPDIPGEIWITVSTTSPCGTLDDELIGCGGPFSIEDPVAPDAGMVWLSPAVLGDPALLGGTVRHELGHALGLAHDQRLYGGEAPADVPLGGAEPGRLPRR